MSDSQLPRSHDYSSGVRRLEIEISDNSCYPCPLSRGSRENKRQREAHNTTMMLIVVIGVFLSVEIPLMVITALHTISSSLKEFMDYNLTKNIVLVINLCIYLSYPLNFAIYCGMSRYFLDFQSNILIDFLFFSQFRATFRLVIISPVVRFWSSCLPDRTEADKEEYLGEPNGRNRK